MPNSVSTMLLISDNKVGFLKCSTSSIVTLLSRASPFARINLMVEHNY